MIQISLPAQALFVIGPVAVTNSHIAAFLMTAGFAGFFFWLRPKLKLVPGRVQAAFELVYEFLFKQVETAFGDEKRARTFFPMYFAMLLFILVANQFSVIPLVSSIVAGETPALRTPTSDLLLTLSLALVVVVLANVLALMISPLHHIGGFIRIAPLFQARSLPEFANAVLGFLLGLLDIIGEIAKVVSLSARLFGNIFAGEVMVVVIAGLSAYTQFLVPVPFIILSVFSGLVQAFVFTLLSIQFLAGTVNNALSAKTQAS